MNILKLLLQLLLILALPAALGAAPLPPERPADLAPIVETPRVKPKKSEIVYQAACPALIGKGVEAKILPPIDNEGCGTTSPYRLKSISVPGRKIRLATPATFNCPMATAFIDWVKEIDQLSRTMHGVGIKTIHTGTSYMCRRRNNSKTGKISEHGFANAIDLTGFSLTDGTEIKLPGAWHTGGKSQKLMRASHRQGCKIFTTVLGPEANALHKDHLHLDMGCHGKNCTYKICD